MAHRIILYWRDIPAQVIIRHGRTSERRELPEHFIQTIDACAMRVGAKDSDAYLAQWRRSDPEPCGDNLGSEADRAVGEIVAQYDIERMSPISESSRGVTVEDYSCEIRRFALSGRR